jgi:DegV family protein with EDD domain
MGVRVVTDSGADLPSEIILDLGIVVVPLYIYFGEKAYRDGLDMAQDELFERLVSSPIHPTTSQPKPADFAGIYSSLSKDADAIVSIHLPAKVSGTCNAALQAIKIAEPACEVQVVDSLSLSAGLGLIVMAAARVAKAGGTLPEVLKETHRVIGLTRILGVLDTLGYLLKGGRITRNKALFGTLLKVKPILTMRDGEIVQAGISRSYSKGVGCLFEFVKEYPNLQEVAIAHSTVPEEANALNHHIASIIDEKKIHMFRLGAALGVHGGPGTLLVAVRSV